MASVSGLSEAHRRHARQMIAQAAALTIVHRDRIHYTQNSPQRWEGINRRLRAWKGEYPTHGDCSGIYHWWVWQGLGHYDVRDTLSNLNWKAGFTGTLATHGKAVKSLGSVLVGDAVLYGDPWGRTGHVAMALGGGKVASFGSEKGPLLLNLDYRKDRHSIRRYI